MKIETILVPTDFSEHADRAFEIALHLASTFGSRLELIHAYDFGQWVTLYEVTFAERAGEKIRLEAAARLQPFMDRARANGLDVSTLVVLGSPSEIIIERANETKADLIVMGTRGRSAVTQLFLGSVAARTLQMAPCPVLTIAAHCETHERPIDPRESGTTEA